MTTGSILWFLAIGVFIYFMMRNGGGCCAHGHSDHGRHEPDSDAKHGDRKHADSHHLMQHEGGKDTNPASTWKDPVCGMEVQGKSAALTSEYQGRTFHFCSEQCRKMFDLYPNKYI